MNDIFVENYLKKIVNYNNRTSYKFYLLLAILELGKQQCVLQFADCGREMIVQAWNDLSNNNFYFPKIDKLKNIKNDILYKNNLLEFYQENILRKEIIKTENKQTINHYMYLTKYCVYLLLSYGQWKNTLINERNYQKINFLISKLSHLEICLYKIESDSLILNLEFFNLINKDTEKYQKIIREELRHYLSKKK